MSFDGVSERAKGLGKREVCVGSMGKGWCTGEAEKSAEKDKGEKSLDEPIRGDVTTFLKFWLDGPMGRGEWFGI